MNIRTIVHPLEIPSLASEDLSSTVCVVFDVLRATSSIVTAIEHGAAEVMPVCTIPEALALKEKFPHAILAGERGGDRIEGFDVGNSPSEFKVLAGKIIITTTTNGTIALAAPASPHALYAGALNNLDALAAKVSSAKNLLLICAGTGRDLALEDVYSAGLLILRLNPSDSDDGSRLAADFADNARLEAEDVLRASANGKALLRAGREADVAECARLSIYTAVPTASCGTAMLSLVGSLS